ncbi:threonine transporter RhtB [filamentous cyanobacterium CCP5]|nr:threonine transporter RhtB [filamentous cyanobacterium CCP5]
MDSQIVAFTLAAAALTIAPGADTMLVVRNVLRGGRRDGVVTTLGICSGLFVHATLSAVGVSVLLMHSAVAFQIVKLIGAGYLVWLGWQSIRKATSKYAPEPIDVWALRFSRCRQRCFWEGCLSNVLNPKTAAFYLAFLPQFIGPKDPVLTKSLLLAGIHYVECIFWLVALSILLDRIRHVLLQVRVRRWLEGICGAVLLGFGAKLAIARP